MPPVQVSPPLANDLPAPLPRRGPGWISAIKREPDNQKYAQHEAALDASVAVTELQNLLLDSPDVVDFLQRLASMVAELVPNTSCGVTTRRDGQVLTVASSDDFAMRLDEVQYHRGHGPCLQALHTGHRVDVIDQTSDQRWPDYRIQALANGVHASVSLPLKLKDTTIGAVNLYSRVPNRFTTEDLHRVELFTAQATVALTLLQRQARHTSVDKQLQEALTVRAIIDQALGIIMAQSRTNSADAFAILREASQNSNRKLSEIAADLIQTVTGQPPQPPRPFIQHK